MCIKSLIWNIIRRREPNQEEKLDAMANHDEDGHDDDGDVGEEHLTEGKSTVKNSTPVPTSTPASSSLFPHNKTDAYDDASAVCNAASSTGGDKKLKRKQTSSSRANKNSKRPKSMAKKAAEPSSVEDMPTSIPPVSTKSRARKTAKISPVEEVPAGIVPRSKLISLVQRLGAQGPKQEELNKWIVGENDVDLFLETILHTPAALHHRIRSAFIEPPVEEGPRPPWNLEVNDHYFR